MSIPNLVEKLNAMFESRISVRPARSLHASNIAHPCERALVLDQVSAKKRERHGVRLQRIFEMGNLIGEQAVIDLNTALRGTEMKVVQQEEPIPPNKWGIGGRIDLSVIVDGKKYPVEVKSCAPFTFDTVDSMYDIVTHRSPWVRKYVGQLQIYMLMANCDVGLFLLRNKVTGEYKQIVCSLDLDYCEDLLTKADRITTAIAKYRGATTDKERDLALPDRIPFDPDFCESCEHFKTCLPDITQAPTLVNMISDIELEAWCRIREQNAEARKAYEEADDKIKAHVTAMCDKVPVKGKLTAMTQSYYITGSVGESERVVDLPELQKKTIAELERPFIKKVKVVRKSIRKVDEPQDA